MSEMLTGFPFEELRALAVFPALPSILYAMVTTFQYAEGVADQQAAEMVNSRLDWKYALQLPVSYVGFDARHLCEFRAVSRQKQQAQAGLERLVGSLVTLGLISGNEGDLGGFEVIRSVCLLNWLEKLVLTMNRALETLAASQPEWLQASMLPHWVERYPWQARNGLPVNREKQTLLAYMIAEDAFYLLETVEAQAETISALPEIENLQKVCQAQFSQDETGLHWLPQECIRCEVPLRSR